MTLDRYTAILCDLDGCLISDNQVLPGAAAFARTCGPRLFVVSNNSTDTPDSLAARLAGIGLPIGADRLILAGVEALDWIARHRPGRRVQIFGSAVLKAEAARRGLNCVDRAPDIVLLTRDTSFSYPLLQRIVAALRTGADLLVSNADGSHPGRDGTPVPETGALLSAVLACLPEQPYTIVGKPEALLFETALDRAGVPASAAVFVGDNPETDGKGAAAAGLDFILVDGIAGSLLDLAQPPVAV